MIDKVDIPIGKAGDYEIVKTSPSAWEAFITNMKSPGRCVYESEIITMLKCKDVIMMSDTEGEMREMWSIVNEAYGHVLIVGLGLGITLREIAKKEEVTKVTVIEISKEIISLVWDHYIEEFGGKIEVINADIFSWRPDKGSFYDVAYYDIWNNICSKNLEEMKRLHRKFARKTGYQESWNRYQCERLREDGNVIMIIK